jgi:hypothetical protein
MHMSIGIKDSRDEVAFVVLHVRHQTSVAPVTGKQKAKPQTIQYEQCS